ncbi:spermidine synthase [Capnocytophaga catalasegens]|nr:fused MFS/spermidine synthase [Capnocytophaga catalasegens]
MIKKILSYIFPIPIHKQPSKVSKSVEVVLYNGRLILNTPNTNYSYGSLQRILRLGLKKIGFEQIRKMQHILLLGLAGGSVVKTLIDEIGYKGQITAVEIDNEIVEIANKYFGINEIGNLKIIIDDAQKFVQKEKNTYDLIIVDIFQDEEMPAFLFSTSFKNKLISLLTSKGLILFNTMKISKKDSKRNAIFIQNCQQETIVNVFSKVEGNNELILISKKNNKF